MIAAMARSSLARKVLGLPREEREELLAELLDSLRDDDGGEPDVPPGWGGPGGPEVRRWPLRRYPLCLFFVVRGERLIVVAAAHTRRHPGYWRARLGP